MSDTPEVVSIPTHGDSALTGAAIFLAVLAYPNDCAKGNRFLAAVARSIDRFKQGNALLRDDRRLIASTWEKIHTRRIPAANASLNLHANSIDFGKIRLRSKYDNITQLAQDLERFHLTRHTDPNNFLPQVWKDSWPVLHMAMGLVLTAADVLRRRDRDEVPALLHDTSWLIPALRRSAFHLLLISQFVRGFDPNACILMLSNEADPTLDLFKRAIRGEAQIILPPPRAKI